VASRGTGIGGGLKFSGGKRKQTFVYLLVTPHFKLFVASAIYHSLPMWVLRIEDKLRESDALEIERAAMLTA
jgi:hypothetical protein